jgi:hypothetical protein
MFMTHAPGAVVPPRKERKVVSDSFAGRLLGSFGLGRKKKKPPEAVGGGGPPGRGLDAGPPVEKKPGWEDKSWAAQQIKHDAGPQVVTAATTTAPATPGFLRLALAAFGTPLRGFQVALVHVVIVALALLMLELSPFLGLLACAVAGAELLALLVRLMRDACAGREIVAWPDVGSMASALLPVAATALLVVPGVVLTAVAFGPSATEGDSSIAARAKRILAPIPQGETLPDDAALGHSTLLMLEAAMGVVDASGAPAPTRSTQAVAEAIEASAKIRLADLLDVGSASPAGLAARLTLLLGLLACPLALLCAVRTQSAASALHLPLLVRSSVRVAGPILFVSAFFAVQAVLTLGVLVALPAHVRGTAGHVVWVSALAVLLVCLPMIKADLLGRIYQAHQVTLAWD